MKIFGRSYKKRELLRHIGDISQIAAITPSVLQEGNTAGVRTLTVRTGDGFSFVVVPDRGLDISWAEYQGKPLCWRSSTGEVHPAFYEPQGLGWLRSFFGGLLTTCGLTSVGAPSEDAGETLGLHGRVSNLPASHVYADGAWDGDEYNLWIQGKIRETSVFGATLELTRHIETRLGEHKLTITDCVENLGHTPAPHMYRYHINAGFPVVAAGSRIIAPTKTISPYDEIAASGLNQWHCIEEPQDTYQEQVFYLDLQASPDNTVTVAIINPDSGNGTPFGFYIKYGQTSFPYFLLWKTLAAGTYAIGLEPSNCYDEGRAIERQRGTLVELQPGEQRRYTLEIGVLNGIEATNYL